MKTCVSSYSFSQAMSAGEFNQLTVMAKAKSMGFDAIEFTDLNPIDGLSVNAFAALLREESEKLGLPIVNYAIGADFLNAESVEQEIERLYAQVDIASILGCKTMRHDATGGYRDDRRKIMSFDNALPTLVKGCKGVTEYAKTKGVATSVENHGFFCQDSCRVEKLVTGVSDENFGILIDVGNFACADDPSGPAVGRLAPFAKHVHVKDFVIKDGNGFNPGDGFFKSRGGNYLKGTIVGQGDIPVLQCLSVLKNSGYDGFVSIEFEGMEPCVKAIGIGLDNLKRMFELI